VKNLVMIPLLAALVACGGGGSDVADVADAPACSFPTASAYFESGARCDTFHAADEGRTYVNAYLLDWVVAREKCVVKWPDDDKWGCLVHSYFSTDYVPSVSEEDA
jgi:hypothetical protein